MDKNYEISDYVSLISPELIDEKLTFNAALHE
jgi:hypothetical protein